MVDVRHLALGGVGIGNLHPSRRAVVVAVAHDDPAVKHGVAVIGLVAVVDILPPDHGLIADAAVDQIAHLAVSKGILVLGIDLCRGAVAALADTCRRGAIQIIVIGVVRSRVGAHAADNGAAVIAVAVFHRAVVIAVPHTGTGVVHIAQNAARIGAGGFGRHDAAVGAPADAGAAVGVAQDAADAVGGGVRLYGALKHAPLNGCFRRVHAADHAADMLAGIAAVVDADLRADAGHRAAVGGAYRAADADKFRRRQRDAALHREITDGSRGAAEQARIGCRLGDGHFGNGVVLSAEGSRIIVAIPTDRRPLTTLQVDILCQHGRCRRILCSKHRVGTVTVHKGGKPEQLAAVGDLIRTVGQARGLILVTHGAKAVVAILVGLHRFLSRDRGGSIAGGRVGRDLHGQRLADIRRRGGIALGGGAADGRAIRVPLIRGICDAVDQLHRDGDAGMGRIRGKGRRPRLQRLCGNRQRRRIVVEVVHVGQLCCHRCGGVGQRDLRLQAVCLRDGSGAVLHRPCDLRSLRFFRAAPPDSRQLSAARRRGGVGTQRRRRALVQIGLRRVHGDGRGQRCLMDRERDLRRADHRFIRLHGGAAAVLRAQHRHGAAGAVDIFPVAGDGISAVGKRFGCRSTDNVLAVTVAGAVVLHALHRGTELLSRIDVRTGRQGDLAVHQVIDDAGRKPDRRTIAAAVAPGIVVDVGRGGQDQVGGAVPGLQRHGFAACAACTAIITSLFLISVFLRAACAAAAPGALHTAGAFAAGARLGVVAAVVVAVTLRTGAGAGGI